MLQRRGKDEVRVLLEVRVLAVDASAHDGDDNSLPFGATLCRNTSWVDRRNRASRHGRKTIPPAAPTIDTVTLPLTFDMNERRLSFV
jgi:hypothetical protein